MGLMMSLTISNSLKVHIAFKSNSRTANASQLNSLGQFLAEISQYPLLSLDQDIRLGPVTRYRYGIGVQELKTTEIAMLMNRSDRQVRALLRKARDLMRQQHQRFVQCGQLEGRP